MVWYCILKCKFLATYKIIHVEMYRPEMMSSNKKDNNCTQKSNTINCHTPLQKLKINKDTDCHFFKLFIMNNFLSVSLLFLHFANTYISHIS